MRSCGCGATATCPSSRRTSTIGCPITITGASTRRSATSPPGASMHHPRRCRPQPDPHRRPIFGEVPLGPARYARRPTLHLSENRGTQNQTETRTSPPGAASTKQRFCWQHYRGHFNRQATAIRILVGSAPRRLPFVIGHLRPPTLREFLAERRRG